VTGRRNIIIAVSAIVVFAAIVGFFITLDVSPQIAYARLFIDAGLVIGLIAVVMAFYRDRELQTEPLITGISNLKSGHFKTRIPQADLGPLGDIATAINELAVMLDDQQQRQDDIKRSLREELLPSLKHKEAAIEQAFPSIAHSFHPELGPVHSLANGPAAKPRVEPYQTFRDAVPVPMAKKLPNFGEGGLSNTLISSSPPKADQAMGSDAFTFNKKEQDLSELYERFVNAQKAFNIDQIEYALFLNTIEKTKKDLMSSYKCESIFFDIVKESNQVALQPKIVRVQ